jgi:hypothetical protein
MLLPYQDKRKHCDVWSLRSQVTKSAKQAARMNKTDSSLSIIREKNLC